MMKKLILGILSLVLLAVACKKEEFQQEPHGEKVPYIDEAKYDLKTLTSMSASHKLLAAAWQRSHLDDAIKALGASAKVTLFAPDDAAMRAAGFDEAAIAAATPEALDSLLMFHVIDTKLDSITVAPLTANNPGITLLKHDTYKEFSKILGGLGNWNTYQYRQYISMKNGSLFMNGKDAGNEQPVMATNGTFWPIKRVTQRPHETMMEYLSRDPRFSIFSRLVRETDELWPILSEYSFDRSADRTLKVQDGTNIFNDAFFAPTDEAFRNAGFNTYEDLWALNERSMPYFDWDFFEMRNNFVTDSLLAYHAWGRYYAPGGSWGPGPGIPAMLFSNDLRYDFVKDFAVNGYNNLGPVPAFLSPLEVHNEGGQITVKVTGSNHPAAKVVEADIYTFQGPLHAVDHLILSNKVKF